MHGEDMRLGKCFPLIFHHHVVIIRVVNTMFVLVRDGNGGSFKNIRIEKFTFAHWFLKLLQVIGELDLYTCSVWS